MGSLSLEMDFEPSPMTPRSLALTPRSLARRRLFPNVENKKQKERATSGRDIICIERLSLLSLQSCENVQNGFRNNQHISKWRDGLFRLRAKLLQNKDRPTIINVTIGTTFKGAIDDVDVILETLKDCGHSQDRFYIHCDAALCGLMTPFINNMISFKKPIGSVTISGHKFLGCPMPCGVQITRKSYINNLSTNVEYIASVDATISGSRNGLTPIFLWYSLSAKGQIGLQKDVKRCLDNAKYLKDRLQQAGINVMLNELSIIVVLERPRDHEFVHRWQLSCVKDMAHVIVMPGITREMLDNFISELVQQRKQWYKDGKAEAPCVGEDIGAQNCACSYHKIDYISP
ncbi:hypothetical protein H5410_042513 [Solanum commersonii]|uniref:Uncharacterized protein n=1 Tax=Solanum commersonii TaxID=4109 RepID=A0A9J5XWK6_SOLCO|nr:hypothetical protein H5410_042513 [Solanum commersonii]